ncbi:MAG: oxidoreductase [Planctomycetes bacterium]|nr:oxidoreductase [Planctomycetota bacterium]
MHPIPWLEVTLFLPLFSALFVAGQVTTHRRTIACQIVTGLTFVLATICWFEFYRGSPLLEVEWPAGWAEIMSRSPFRIDELAAPLVPAVALFQFMTALATTRTKIARFPFASILISESICLMTFASRDWSLLTGLLISATIPPALDLLQRGKPARIYLVYQAAYVVLLIAAWIVHEFYPLASPFAWSIPLLIAIMIRSGLLPFHSWLTDLFEEASMGMALTSVVPVTGAMAAVRLLLPSAPDSVLTWLAGFALATAIYTAGMALVQREVRRFFTYLFLSHSSLILAGIDLHTPLSMTGSFCVWFSVIFSLGGLGLTIRSLEARYGRQSLVGFHGLYENSPILAAFFVLTGLASVGFPGTVGFVSGELLVDGALEAGRPIAFLVVAAAAINGIAIIRAYLILFTGARHQSLLPLRVKGRERVAVLTLSALIMGGGLFPQPGVLSRFRAAEQILGERGHRPLENLAIASDERK